MKKFLILLMLSFPAQAGNEKQVLATVDGQKVTRGQIESALAEVAEMVDGGKPKLETFPKDFQKEFIDKYIDKMLLVEAGRKKNVHKDPEIREQVKAVEDFLTQKKFLQDLVLSKKSDKALRKIYNEKLAAQKDEVEVHASHILVETEKEAENMKKQLEEGADFEELAKANSTEPGAKVNAGDLGYFVAGDMVPQFSEVVFKLKEDEISKPIKSDFGWHIAKLHDKRKKKKLSFKKAKPNLETELARRTITAEVEKLRKAKKIEYKLDFGQKKKAQAEKVKAKKVDIKKIDLTKKQKETVIAAVNKASKAWKDAFNAGKAANCAAQYEQNAVMKAEPFGTFKGKKSIQKFWQKLIDDGYSDIEYIKPKIEVIDAKTAVLKSGWKMNKAQGIIHKELWVIQDDGSAKLKEDHFEAKDEKK